MPAPLTTCDTFCANDPTNTAIDGRSLADQPKNRRKEGK